MSLFLRREQDRGHPELSFFDFDLRRLLDRTKNTFPSLVSTPVEVWVQRQATLACIRTSGAPVSIHLHSVLNHPTTSERVVAFILCHELLHLIIPPREVSGKCSAHPPEFWDTEQDMLPDRSLTYGWLILVLGSCLKRDKEQECTFVKTNWKKLMNENRPTLDQIETIRDCSKSVAQDKEELLL